MSGTKGHSGGRREGSGPKPRKDLADLHAVIDSQVSDADWGSIYLALLKRAKRGNVQAIRELRASSFGLIPAAAQPIDDAKKPIMIHMDAPCPRKHVDDPPDGETLPGADGHGFAGYTTSVCSDPSSTPSQNGSRKP